MSEMQFLMALAAWALGRYLIPAALRAARHSWRSM